MATIPVTLDPIAFRDQLYVLFRRLGLDACIPDPNRVSESIIAAIDGEEEPAVIPDDLPVTGRRLYEWIPEPHFAAQIEETLRLNSTGKATIHFYQSEARERWHNPGTSVWCFSSVEIAKYIPRQRGAYARVVYVTPLSRHINPVTNMEGAEKECERAQCALEFLSVGGCACLILPRLYLQGGRGIETPLFLKRILNDTRFEFTTPSNVGPGMMKLVKNGEGNYAGAYAYLFVQRVK